ncbi:MAG TPA: ABC transporter substrate-binding protein [Alphaproteobacteria bacterium]|nr:ABC transporter substrate-binding protein [Alphaproteobacteria bacterium]
MSDLEKMKSLAAKGKVSRREFIQYALAAGMTVAAAETLFVKTVRAQPKQGGFAKIGLAHGATTDSMDPATYPDTGSQVPLSGSLSNSLTEVDAKGNVIPDLAESMEISDDAKTWVFRLRKGVTFHNGKDLTANDVVVSFRHHMGAESKSAAKSLLDQVTDIKADGKDTVVFTLAGGNADFAYVASEYHIVIMPAKEDGTADWESGVRTGAFVLENFEPGVRSKLKRNPNYHKEGKPYFDEVEFLNITDLAARANALTTGEVHYIGRPDLKTLDRLKQNPQIEVDEVTGYAHYVFVMNTTVPPFDNPDVRRALKYAINREEIAKKIFLGHATPGNDNPIPPPPAVKFSIDPEPRHAYDPEKAKHYLKQAGLTSLKVDLSVADAAFTGAVDAAVLYKEDAAKAGVDINVIREPNDGYWDKVWLKKGFVASYWSGRPTADWMFTTTYAAGAEWNESYWNNPRFNELLVVARAETDESKRAAMYAEMQQLVHDDGGTIVLVFNNLVSAHSKQLAHGDIAPNWEVDGLRLAERWWFA